MLSDLVDTMLLWFFVISKFNEQERSIDHNRQTNTIHGILEIY